MVCSSKKHTNIDTLYCLMKQAGLLAGVASDLIKNQGGFKPILLKPNNDSEYSLDFLMDEEAVETSIEQVEQNPYALPYQILASDSYAYLPTVGGTPVIRLEIYSYQPDQHQMVLVIPYERVPFKIFSVVRYSRTQLSHQHFKRAIRAFYEGAFEFLSPETKESLWKVYFEDRDYQMCEQTSKFTEFLDQSDEEECFGEAIPVTPKPQILSHIKKQYKNPFQSICLASELNKLPQHYRQYLQVALPVWMKKDLLYRQIQAMPELYLKGRVVWGALIHTNQQMYEPLGDNSPAEILYDPKGQTNPKKLVQLAQKLQSLKNLKCDYQDQREYVACSKNEKYRLVNYPFPSTVEDLPIRISTIWLWRLHLPNGILSMPCFPILLAPNDSGYAGEAMVLPAWFWPQILRDKWLNAAEAQLGNSYDLSRSIVNKLAHMNNLHLGVDPKKLEPPLALLFEDEKEKTPHEKVKIKVKKPPLEKVNGDKKKYKIRKLRLKQKQLFMNLSWSKCLTYLTVGLILVKIFLNLT